jgi:hypothetical protein
MRATSQARASPGRSTIYRWTPQTDPFGVRHETIDYPGVPVDRVARRRPVNGLWIFPNFGSAKLPISRVW